MGQELTDAFMILSKKAHKVLIHALIHASNALLCVTVRVATIKNTMDNQ